MKPIMQASRPDPAGWLHLELARREMLVLADAQGQTLVCQAGELWLTEEGGGEDHILRAGDSYSDSYTICSPGRLVLSACQPARFSLRGRSSPARVSVQRVKGFLASWLPRELPQLLVPGNGV